MEKSNENRETSAKLEIDTSKILIERSPSKIETDKNISANKDQSKVNTSNKIPIISIGKSLTPKISISNKKTKNNFTYSEKYNTKVDLVESPLSKSRKIYTQIASSSIYPLNEDISEEKDLDFEFSDYQLLPHKENEFIKNQLQANKLQKKIFKKLRIEKNLFNSNSLISNSSTTNFNSNSVFLHNNLNQSQLNNNLYDCYKFYERTKNVE